MVTWLLVCVRVRRRWCLRVDKCLNISYHLHQLLGLQETLLKPDLLGFGLGAGSGDPAEQQLGMFMGNIYARNKKVSRSQRYHVFKANRATLRQLLSCFQSCRSSVLALIFSKQLFGAP